jgi:hypothetical protein
MLTISDVVRLTGRDRKTVADWIRAGDRYPNVVQEQTGRVLRRRTPSGRRRTPSSMSTRRYTEDHADGPLTLGAAPLPANPTTPRDAHAPPGAIPLHRTATSHRVSRSGWRADAFDE